MDTSARLLILFEFIFYYRDKWRQILHVIEPLICLQISFLFIFEMETSDRLEVWFIIIIIIIIIIFIIREGI